MKYEDRIDKYLLGKMTSKEEKEFIKECKTNPVLKEEAIAMAYLVKAIKQTKYEKTNRKTSKKQRKIILF